MSGRVERAVIPEEERAATNERICALLTCPDPGPMAERLAVLCFTGRRTGRSYRLPVGIHRINGAPVIATSGRWRHNFAGGGDAELTWRSQRRIARLAAVADPERTARAYLELYGLDQETAERRLGIAVTGQPNLGAFRDAVERCGLTLLEVQFDDSNPSDGVIPSERTAPQ